MNQSQIKRQLKHINADFLLQGLITSLSLLYGNEYDKARLSIDLINNSVGILRQRVIDAVLVTFKFLP